MATLAVSAEQRASPTRIHFHKRQLLSAGHDSTVLFLKEQKTN
jgi:hypothetical protein